MTYKIHRDGDTKTFEDKGKWRTMCDMLDQNDVEYTTTEPDTSTDGGEVEADVVDHTAPDLTPTAEPTTEDTDAALEELGDSLETDPLGILPGHMIDHIQGQPAINKRGYAMIAERYGVSVKAYIESYPWENDEGRRIPRRGGCPA